jgi:hypothetical protein
LFLLVDVVTVLPSSRCLDKTVCSVCGEKFVGHREQVNVVYVVILHIVTALHCILVSSIRDQKAPAQKEKSAR